MTDKTISSARDVREFRNKILRWFGKNKRRYPWRETPDPFRVLIAEMMLRRTKADQVVPVYEHFLRKYPNVKALANSKNAEVKKILYPLGLKWRTAAFQVLAREIAERHRNQIPDTREELASLPGVGEYVTGAVMSLAYGKEAWIVDSNIARLYKRYFGVETSGEPRRDRRIIEIAKMYCSCRDPRRANLAIIDFSAIICTSRNPKHDRCVLRDNCFYFKAMNY